MKSQVMQHVVAGDHNMRVDRLNRIAAAFNAVEFDEEGAVVGDGISDKARAELVKLVTDKRTDQGGYQQRQTGLALEIMRLSRELKLEAAREYLHRVIVFL